MIAKHIYCKPENDNYQRLAKYIADASKKGEKCLVSWCTACEGSDNDYFRAIEEVTDIQDLNTRSLQEKTYHLVVSLRMEDEGKLNEQDYQDIEQEFAKALGFENHQRHCGVHKNTDNLHIHIAYNMINPNTFRRHEPFRDYYSLERTCRAIEQKYNLAIDNGITKDNAHKLSNNSASKEVRTGEESFERYVLNKHDEVMSILSDMRTWENVHRTFAYYGLELTQRGNGLSIKNRRGNQRLKASTFDKELSYKKLTEKLGVFQEMKSNIQAIDWYRRTPLQRSAFENGLWKEFIKETRQAELYEIRKKWKEEKIRLTRCVLSSKRQKELIALAKVKERQEINKVRESLSINTNNWLTFLQAKAEQGNEHALEVLRSTPPNRLSQNRQLHARKGYKEKLNEEKTLLDIKQNILSSEKSYKAKKILLAVEQFKKAADIAGEDFSYKITTRGAIIFELAKGGKIIDTGKQITCTQGREEFAEKYQAIKMGKNFVLNRSQGLSR